MAIPENTPENRVSVYSATEVQRQNVCRNRLLSRFRQVKENETASLEYTERQGKLLLDCLIAKRRHSKELLKLLEEIERNDEVKTPAQFNELVSKGTQTTPEPKDDVVCKEMMKYADKFEETDDGRAVINEVEELSLDQLSESMFNEFMEKIPAILKSTARGSGFTVKTLAAIYLCLREIIWKAIQKYAPGVAQKYIRWCFSYVKGRLTQLVQQNGGYEKILGIYFWKTVRKCCVSLGILSVCAGAIYYVWKN